MQQNLIAKQYIDYHKSFIDHVFDAFVLLQDQAERMISVWVEKHQNMITENQNSLQYFTNLISMGSKDYRQTVYNQLTKLEGLFESPVHLHEVGLENIQEEDFPKQASSKK